MTMKIYYSKKVSHLDERASLSSPHWLLLTESSVKRVNQLMLLYHRCFRGIHQGLKTFKSQSKSLMTEGTFLCHF